jgi:hypothetical protein
MFNPFPVRHTFSIFHSIKYKLIKICKILMVITGFYKQQPRACCGAAGMGSYNFNLTAKCGDPGATACDDPKTHWNWDGIHLTEASYGHIAKGWLYGPYADPPILSHSSAQ